MFSYRTHEERIAALDAMHEQELRELRACNIKHAQQQQRYWNSEDDEIRERFWKAVEQRIRAGEKLTYAMEKESPKFTAPMRVEMGGGVKSFWTYQ